MGNRVDSVLIRPAICTDFDSRNVEIARYVNRRVVVVIIAFIVFQMLSRSVRSFGREKNIARGKFKGREDGSISISGEETAKEIYICLFGNSYLLFEMYVCIGCWREFNINGSRVEKSSVISFGMLGVF